MHSDFLKRFLLRDARRSVRAFYHLADYLGKERAKFYGLTDAPVRVLFGPDIENVILSNGQLIARGQYRYRNDEYSNPRLVSLLNYMNKHLKRLSYDGYENEPHSYEGDALETRFKPSAPLQIIRNYYALNEAASRKAESLGLEFVPGSGHWHYSIWQSNKDVLGYFGAFTDIALHTAIGILELYEKCPAFVVQPAHAEATAANLNQSMPNTLQIGNWVHSHHAIRMPTMGKQVEMTIEPRLAVNAPEQPVALLLKAMLYGLKQRGMVYGLENYHPLLPAAGPANLTIPYDPETNLQTARFPLLRKIFNFDSLLLHKDGTLKYSGEYSDPEFVCRLCAETILDKSGRLVFPDWARDQVGGSVKVYYHSEINLPETKTVVSRGPSGFLEMLKETRDSGFAVHLFGSLLTDLMLLDSVLAYEDYLKGLSVRLSYPSQLLRDIRAELEREFSASWRQGVLFDAEAETIAPTKNRDSLWSLPRARPDLNLKQPD